MDNGSTLSQTPPATKQSLKQRTNFVLKLAIECMEVLVVWSMHLPPRRTRIVVSGDCALRTPRTCHVREFVTEHRQHFLKVAEAAGRRGSSGQPVAALHGNAPRAPSRIAQPQSNLLALVQVVAENRCGGRVRAHSALVRTHGVQLARRVDSHECLPWGDISINWPTRQLYLRAAVLTRSTVDGRATGAVEPSALAKAHATKRARSQQLTSS